MEYCYYEMNYAPDFSLSKYASLSETGPSGVLVQHQAFWRQLNQWGKLFGGSIHFIYEFDPGQSAGKRLKLTLRFDAPDLEAKDCIQKIMKASVLAPYYEKLSLTEEQCLSTYKYPWQVNLFKKERFILSSTNEKEQFYISSEWEMNESARLYSMLRMLEAAGAHCAYCVDVYPVDYCNVLEEDLKYIMMHLRELVSFKVKASQDSVSSGGRDENAKKALDFYEDLMDEVTTAPHFLVNVQALSESETLAKQILDAAGSEALSAGSYTLYGERFGDNVASATKEGPCCWGEDTAPKNLRYLPHLMTLEQMVPFAVFPVLFPGETIEMLKETVPESQHGLIIGKDRQEKEICFPWRSLSKHAFLAGMPGSGKTNAMMYLISEIYSAGIPVLILEPAKREYRTLTTLEGMQEIALFSPCANSMFPIHINPFEFPIGMKLADHMNRLLDVFNGTFQLDPPMPMLLTEGIQGCYEELLWLPGMVNQGRLKYPTMSMLYEKIERLLDKYQYADEVRSNLQSILQVRIGSLLMREMGDIFDVERSTFPPEQWLERSAVVELAMLGTGPSNFLILMLMTLVRESLDIQPYRPEKPDYKPRHMIFLEEAHNLIANTSVQQPGSLDPKISATAFIAKMLAEARALGEGIVIADQLPTSVAPEVVKNTSLKLGFRLTSQDERSLLGGTMSADEVQMEKMGTLEPGQCFVSYEGLLKPFELQIPRFKGDSVVDDEHILLSALCKPIYHFIMMESAKIISEKLKEKKKMLVEENDRLIKRTQESRKNWAANKKVIVDEEASIRDSKIHNYIPGDVVGRILEEKRAIQNNYESLMEEWCRLTVETLLYYGINVIRKGYLSNKSEAAQEDVQRTQMEHEKWDSVIHPFYKLVQEERAGLKNYAEELGLQSSKDLEDRLKTQQVLIINSWEVYLQNKD